MNANFRAVGPYSIIALLVIIFAVLGMAGIIPFNSIVVFGMIALLALALFW